MTAQHVTAQEEAVEAPRCNIWWHLLIVGGLGALLVGTLFCFCGWLTMRTAANERRVEVMEMQMIQNAKTLDSLHQDVKELLRRSSRAEASDRG